MINTSKEKFSFNIFTESMLEQDKSKKNSEDDITTFQPTSKKIKQIKQFEDILSMKIVNLSDLKSVSWNGIPFENPIMRAEIWRILLGFAPQNSEIREKTLRNKRQDYFQATEIYSILLENPQKNMNDTEFHIYKQIMKDLPRTMPEYKFFAFEKIHKMMLRILFAWSLRHPASGYVQGFNDLCTPFILVFTAQFIKDLNFENLDTFKEEIFNQTLTQEQLLEIESDSYCCLTAMLNKIQNNYTSNQPGLHKMMVKMEEIISLVDGEMIEHFKKQEVLFIHFSFRWFNCYLTREFSMKNIIRLWDTYFSEDDAFNSFHLFVCASLLLNFSEKLKKMSFSEMIPFLQNLPTNTWNEDNLKVLLAKAFQIKSFYGKTLGFTN